MAYKPADKAMLTIIADAPIHFFFCFFSGSIIFEINGVGIRILMTQPVPDRNPPPVVHNPIAHVVHHPAPARQEFTSKFLREPPLPQQPQHCNVAHSTEVPKSVRFALPHQAESHSQGTRQEQQCQPQHQPSHRAPSPESATSSGFSKKPTSAEERHSQRIRFDIRKSGENSWDVYNGDVMIEQSKFKILNPHPDEQKFRFLCGKKEAQMAIYVNPAGEYFLKHGDKGNTDWYKYKNN